MSADQTVIARVEAELMSGRTFSLCAASFKSIRGYQPPTGHRQYAAAIAVLAEGAKLSDRQATLVSRVIGSLPLHMQAGDMVGRMYEVARKALDEPYFDTIRNASPEPGRHSDNVHDWTLADRLAFKATLAVAASKIVPTGSVLGWAFEALVERDHVRVINEALSS